MSANTTSVILETLVGANDAQREFAERARALAERVIQSDAFRTALLKRHVTSVTWEGVDGIQQGMPMERAHALIVAGQELGTAGEGIINLKIELVAISKFPFRSRTIGYVNHPDPTIHTGRWFIDECIRNNDPSSLAAHWMHEWMHVAGFVHASRHSKWGDISYSVGEIVLELGEVDGG
jgi:hypothetical protein